MSEIKVPTERDGDVFGNRSEAFVTGRHESDLLTIAAQARSDFGLHCFWNAPVLSDPADDARLVAERLRRYGGRRGWLTAVAIDGLLREAVAASDGVDRVPAHGASLPRP